MEKARFSGTPEEQESFTRCYTFSYFVIMFMEVMLWRRAEARMTCSEVLCSASRCEVNARRTRAKGSVSLIKRPK